jgi:DNA-binding beta-propeller fold protein YncE
LLQVDKSTGSVLGSTPLSLDLGAVAGMAFDPATGTFFVADGGSGGTDSLYTLEPATGVLTLRGATVPGGLAGLAVNPVPEPTGLTLAGAGALGLVGYGWRRKRPA